MEQMDFDAIDNSIWKLCFIPLSLCRKMCIHKAHVISTHTHTRKKPLPRNGKLMIFQLILALKFDSIPILRWCVRACVWIAKRKINSHFVSNFFGKFSINNESEKKTSIDKRLMLVLFSCCKWKKKSFVNLQVCSWVTYLIMSQPSQQEQKAAFGCLLRAALSCWNIGNFNGAMEITTGLR